MGALAPKRRNKILNMKFHRNLSRKVIVFLINTLQENYNAGQFPEEHEYSSAGFLG